jgi:hygromycin-B 7''-O-kinase
LTSSKRTSLLPVIETWDAWGRIFTDVQLWKPAVIEICERASISPESVQSGYPGTNAVFVVNQRYVVKIYAPFCHDDYHLERELLSILGKNDAIPVPLLYAKGILEDRISWPFIVMEYLPGQPIKEVRDKISPKNMTDLAAQMGTIVRALHDTPLSMLRNLDCSRNGWRRYRQQQLKSIVKKLQRRRTLPDAVIQAVPTFVDSELAKHHEDQDVHLVLVHGDLTEDHWLLHNAQGQWSLTALIDFADAKISPATYEWGPLWVGALGSHHKSLEAFMRSYDPHLNIDGDFYRHAMAYTFLHEFGAEIIEYVLHESVRHHITSIDHLIQVLWVQDHSAV